MSNPTINFIGLFIDGQYYFRLDKAMQQTQKRRVKMDGLINSITESVSL